MVQPKSYLSPSEKERIERDLKQIRARRKATSEIKEGDPQYYSPPEVDIDDGHMAAKEARLRGVLERESAPHLDPSRRNAAYKEFRSLLKEWEENSLTKYDQGLGYPEIMKRLGEDKAVDFEKAKHKSNTWEGANRGQYVGHRLKELAGVIDPDNPQLRNLENYRRRK